MKPLNLNKLCYMKKLIFILSALLLTVACKGPAETTQKAPAKEKQVVQVEVFKSAPNSNTSSRVEKWTIEGHEYLVFYSKVANPPTVRHSESCPCHESR